MGHATHPHWRGAADLVLAQLSAPTALAGRLGIVYASPSYADALDELVGVLRQRTGVPHWVGGVGHGVCATGVEYGEDPALAVLLTDLAEADFRVFSGLSRLGSPLAGFRAHCALVHADPGLPDLQGLLDDLSSRVESGFLFGGLVAGDGPSQVADHALSGGLSGAAFSPEVRLLSRVTQGCSPLGAPHVISECTEHYLLGLDGRPALDVLLDDLGVVVPAGSARDGEAILRALPADRLRQGLLVGLSGSDAGRNVGFGDYLVRNVVGIDPHHRLLAVGDVPREGDRAVFCTRDTVAARRDLVRVCTELRAELEDEGLQARGALYHSCVARGEHLFGGAGVELEIIRHNLGDLPLAGLHLNGEIARNRLYGYTGVLTLFA